MEKIQIKCSSCGQKFAVSESYKDRIVECGACDHRFKVAGDAILQQKKKFYPGERTQLNSDNFAKLETDTVPQQAEANSNLGFQPALQHKNVGPGYAQPPSAKRSFAILVGAGLIILFIVIFIVGSSQNGMLENVDEQKRILLAAFIAILGCALIIGGFRHKIKGLAIALVLGGSLLALPFVFPVAQTPEVTDGDDLGFANSIAVDEVKTKAESEKKIDAYKNDIGYRKVISRRENASNAKLIKAIVVRDIGSHTDTICDYLEEELNLESKPITYASERSLEGRRVTLIILEHDVSTPDLVEITKKFGDPAEMNQMRTELDVIEVLVKEDRLTSTSTDILTDETNPLFFSGNYQELFNISRDRRLAAVQRLEKVKSSLGRRSDIADKLSKMINVKNQTISNEAIRALNKWTIPEYKLDHKVKNYAEALADKGNLNTSVMEYLIEKKIPDISDILAKQWLNSNGHLIWDDLIKQAGPQGELAIIKALPQADSAHLKAASSVLMKIGTTKSLPALSATLNRADKEDAKYLKATIDEIKSPR